MKTNARIRSVERATEKNWESWLQFMDGIQARSLRHDEIASIVLKELDEKMDNPGWWSQAVTVAYEQYIGRRVPGQRSDGTFQASISKATALGTEALMDRWVNFALGDEEVRGEMIDDARVSGTDKRITWRTKARAGWSIRVTSEPKKNGTTSIVVNLIGLESLEDNDEAKAQWASILQRFVEIL